ncbi:MAG TPA: caspase family protein [Flavobacteriales bacterium]|nr:caspase family protein [Flavobacteriales bacterium]
MGQKQIVPQNGHAGSYVVSISPDDKRMLTAGIDGKLMVWDLERSKAVKSIKASSQPLLAAAWSIDGSTFMCAGMDSVITQYNAITFQKGKEFKTPFGITKACYHTKLNAMALGGANGKVMVIDAEKGSVYHEIDAGSYVTGIKFSSNGSILFVSSWDNGVAAYEMQEAKRMLNIPLKNNAKASGLQVSANDEFLFIHINNGTTEVVNTFSGETLGTVNDQAYYTDTNGSLYTESALTHDNTFVINTDKNNNIVIGNWKTNIQLTYNNIGCRAKISTVTPSNKGGFFIVSDASGSMCMVYFNAEMFQKELALYWRKMQYVPERIYNLTFINNQDVLAMQGTGYYNFNMRTGDMFRRDNDSAKFSGTEYFVTYIAKPGSTTDYYYTDLVKHEGYFIKGNNPERLKAFACSADSSQLAVQHANNEIYVIDIKTRQEIYANKTGENARLFNGPVHDMFYYQKTDYLFAIDRTGKSTPVKLLSKNPVITIACDEKRNELYTLDHTGQISAYDKDGKNVLLNTAIGGKHADMIDISKNGKYMVISHDKKISVIDLDNYATAYEIDNSYGMMYSMAFSADGNKLATSAEDGLVRVYDVNKKQLLFNLLASQQDGMIVYTPDNYYMATKEAARQIVITEGSSVYSLENIDLSYNRPDLVLKSIGMANENLVNAYKFAYDRRIKKLGVKTGKAENPPTISLANRQEIKSNTISPELALQFKVNGNGSPVSRINIWINDVPVSESRNKIDGSKTDHNIMVHLLSGTNKIKYCAVNENGIESDKEELVVVNLANKKPNLYLLSIGTSEYKDNRFNLTYASKDANDLVDFFGKGSNSKTRDQAFAKIFTHALTNAQVTKANIEKEITFLKEAGSNDVVIIFIAGHGVRDADMNYFFGTYDMDFNAPAGKGMSEGDLTALLDQLTALRKLIFFDTCLSGEVDKDEVETFASVKTSEGDVSFRSAGAGLRSKSIGLSNASALMREIYNNLDEGTGSTIISSAGGAEYAMESAEWKNGLFTYCLLNGLKTMAADANKDNAISVHEIQDYVRRQVYQLSKGKQQPSFKNENILMDFRVW